MLSWSLDVRTAGLGTACRAPTPGLMPQGDIPGDDHSGANLRERCPRGTAETALESWIRTSPGLCKCGNRPRRFSMQFHRGDLTGFESAPTVPSCFRQRVIIPSTIGASLPNVVLAVSAEIIVVHFEDLTQSSERTPFRDIRRTQDRGFVDSLTPPPTPPRQALA